MMIELYETEYQEDGSFETKTKKYTSKWALLKIMKKSALPTKVIYDLNKYDEAEFVWAGTKRKLKIVKI